MNTPLVSICCITYNHAPFIRKCLDGFLMQQTNFPLEILIHDDCSTDGTTEIIREYEAKYPNLIFPLYEEVNQYQQGKATEIDFYNYRRARGKYIAYCEGDDYWTDPLKLQKQVDFMEANPDYSVCFHDYVVYNMKEKKYINKRGVKLEFDCDISVDDYLNNKIGIGQPLTMLFRVEKFDYRWQSYYTHYCDMMEITHLLLVGKGRVMMFNGGQYNLHQGGVNTSKSFMKLSEEYCLDVHQMWDSTHHPSVKRFYIDAYMWRLDLCVLHQMYIKIFQTLLLVLKHDFYIGVKICTLFIKRKLKTLLYYKVKNKNPS